MKTHFLPQIIGAGILIILALIWWLLKSNKKSKIKTSLISLGFGFQGERKESQPTKPQGVRWKNKNKEIVFYLFNYSQSTIDFYKNQHRLEELFQCEFVKFVRPSNFKVRAIKANWKNFKKETKEQNRILLASNGEDKIFQEDIENSIFNFGLTGSGKTFFNNGCIINQYQKLGAEIHIITNKKSDYKNCYSYDVDKEKNGFKKILNEIETKRQGWEHSGITNQKPILIVFDECQYANEDKDFVEHINRIIRTGRSQKINILLSTQSGTVGSIRNIEINLVGIKIAQRGVESLAFGETIFPKEVAEKAFHIQQPIGFGFLKTTKHKASKVRFYYE